MSTFPFTTNGAEQFFSALYQLSEDALQEEIMLVQQDFKAWIAQHFVLSEEQQVYLAGLSQNFAQSAGALTASAMSYRLPVILIKPEGNSGQLRKGKLVDTKNNIVIQHAEDQDEASGEVIFTISY
ncbi:hypothetical protein GCM10023231_18490 [Olivibacter ginsenosidimutans]|uniref:Uncharacterized protein n=1 Tax=Olivibacter ginsenosidimutans TaxID=1176537 RepID=A0ABP9B5Y0_9SPHI